MDSQQSVLPELSWQEYRFPRSDSYWKEVKHQKKFLDELAAKLDFVKPEDWYSLKLHTLRINGGNTSYLVHTNIGNYNE